MKTEVADTAMQSEAAEIRPDSELTVAEKLGWGIFWGFFIGGSWLLADLIRPMIYGG